MPTSTTTSAELDAADPLSPLRERFIGADTPLVYFDGNSLGRPLRVTAERMSAFVTEEWGGRLIRGWDERWYDLPLTLGDELGRVVLGAGPGQVFVGDSTTVLIYKLVRAAFDAAEKGRTEIVVDTDNFPTDRYVAEAIARERGGTLRWIESDRQGGVTPDQVREVVGESTAVVLLSHVAYRSGHLADAAEITRIVHEADALVVWDLCHSVGSVPASLDDWGVDVAVGCSYKYLNGGPGAPAWGYVAERHQETLRQPISGWMGHADPFLMGPEFTPASGARRYLSGTPAVVGMLPMSDMVELIDSVGMTAVREKSRALTSYAVAVADEVLAPLGVTLASPLDADQRGGHVTFNHPRMREVVTTLWTRDVIPDYRDPHGLRVGLSPLSTSFAEVETGLIAVADVLRS